MHTVANANNVGTGKIVHSQKAQAGTLGNTVITIDPTKIKDGDVLTIAGEEYTFAIGANSAVDTKGANVIDLTAIVKDASDLSKVTDTKVQDDIAAAITRATATNKTLNVHFDKAQGWTKMMLTEKSDGQGNSATSVTDAMKKAMGKSMTYCSLDGEVNPESLAGNVRGFDLAAVYRTYDDYVNDAERYFLEYCLRDAYEYYGYGFNWYDGAPMDEAKMQELLGRFERMDYYIRKSWENQTMDNVKVTRDGVDVDLGGIDVAKQICDSHMENVRENREHIVSYLMRGLHFVNRRGQPLHMMPKLELDEALLEQPLYH